MEKKTYPFYYGGVKQNWAKAVVAGGFVFVSGVSGREFETGRVKAVDVKVQTEVTWAKIKSILEEVGSSLNRIVKVVTYLRDAKDADAYYAASSKFLEKECPDLLENPPAMTMAETGLYLEEMLVEIDVTAILPE
ncbi:MAG: RidA family protein [Deltaproteobacteria bacterium]|nr:RidA family protein [Deltaproteobacteria bacterium]